MVLTYSQDNYATLGFRKIVEAKTISKKDFVIKLTLLYIFIFPPKIMQSTCL